MAYGNLKVDSLIYDNSGSDVTVSISALAGAGGAAPVNSPTFTGTVTIPSGASISGYAATGSAQTFTALQTLNAGVDLSGLLVEKFTNTGSFSSDTNVNLADGMLHRYSVAENYTQSPNIRFNASTSLNSVLSVGQAVTVTIIVAAIAGRWMPSLTIDGGAVGDLNWVGGAAPSAGGTSGNDIYTYNILKAANSSFVVIASFAKTS